MDAAAEKNTTVGGYAFALYGFIPVAANDLRKQAEIPALLLDIQDGKRPMADIVQHLHDIELRQQYTRKRVTTAQAKAFFTPVAEVAEKSEAPEPVEGEPAGDNEGDPSEVEPKNSRRRNG